MRFLILIPLVIASAVEYFSQGHFGLAMVSGLYFFLSMQAEHAAKKFLRYGLQPSPAFPYSYAAEEKPSPPPKPEGWASEEPLKVNPLGAKKANSHSYEDPKVNANANASAYARPAEKSRAESVRPLVKPKPITTPAPAKLPETPQFHGKPHEVLVVQENAATRTIVKAFRHWVKKYHPDHAHTPAETQSANERTRMLTDAKEKLLQVRRQKRKAS